jgi:putative flippase GtrA
LKTPLRHWLQSLFVSRREFSVFLVCGVVNTVLTYGLYLVLLWVVSYPTAYTISYAVGILLSYCLNARFVFKEKLRLSKALQYPVVYLVQYLLGIVLLYLLVEIAHLSRVLAPLVIVAITMPITFFLSRFIIKRPAMEGKPDR